MMVLDEVAPVERRSLISNILAQIVNLLEIDS